MATDFKKTYMKPKTNQPKVIGEWVEMKFMVRAAESGLLVSKPFGDSARFDFVVGCSRRLHRVQVRGTSFFANGRAYLVSLQHGKPALPYSASDFEFLAAFVMPFEAWYIIPMTIIPDGKRTVTLYPHQRHSEAPLEKFREAWRLLR